MITIGSCFSGIGGLELGLERSIPGSKVIWQCEQNTFCQQVLKKHWPEARLYNDIRTMSTQDVERPTILCGGFPCQDISLAGKGEGIHGKKSGLWHHMLALISRILPRIVVLENVSAITFRGGRDVVGSLTELGYSCEWGVIRSGSTFGAPHRRARWFCVAYSYHRSEAAEIQARREKHLMCNPRRGHDASNTMCIRCMEHTRLKEEIQSPQYARVQREESEQSFMPKSLHCCNQDAPNTERERTQVSVKGRYPSEQVFGSNGKKRNFWRESQAPPAICGMDDGIPNRVDRLKSLGNAVVPQCAEWIGQQIWRSGLLPFPE